MFKRVLLASLFFIGFNNTSVAGIPVTDGANLAESWLQTAKQIEQYQQQIEQYSLQIRQYEAQALNLVSLPQQIWDDVNNVIAELQYTTNFMKRLEAEIGGSIENLFNQFKVDMSSHGCLISHCSEREQIQFQKEQRILTQLEKSLYDGILQDVTAQQEEIRKEGVTIDKLQSNAKKAEGSLAAQQATNQITAQQNHQLLQLRQSQSVANQATAIRESKRLHEEAKTEARYNKNKAGIISGRKEEGFSFDF